MNKFLCRILNFQIYTIHYNMLREFNTPSTASSPDTRYRKAIKEISKLITANNALKQENDAFKKVCEEQNQTIQNLVEELDKKKQQCCMLKKKEEELCKQRQKLLERQTEMKQSLISSQQVQNFLLELEGQNKSKDELIEELKKQVRELQIMLEQKQAHIQLSEDKIDANFRQQQKIQIQSRALFAQARKIHEENEKLRQQVEQLNKNAGGDQNKSSYANSIIFGNNIVVDYLKDTVKTLQGELKKSEKKKDKEKKKIISQLNKSYQTNKNLEKKLSSAFQFIEKQQKYLQMFDGSRTLIRTSRN